MGLPKLICCVSSLVLASGGALAQSSANLQGSAPSLSDTSTASKVATASPSHAALTADAVDRSATLARGTEIGATLSRTVDARKASAGEPVTAAIAQDVHANGHVVLRRRTKLVGHVTEAQSRRASAADGRRDSRLGIVFDRAVLGDGREVPLNATVQAVASAEAVASTSARAFDHGTTAAKPNSAMQAADISDAAGAAASGLLGNVAGSPGAAADTVAGLGGGVAGVAGPKVPAAASASAGAVGGLSTAGWLTSGSSGVFGLPGVEFVAAEAESAEGHSSVLTSHTRNISLTSGTQMLLVTGDHGAASAEGGADVDPASGRASGEASFE
jgi:hypothetical protein